MTLPIILASASPARLSLLKQIHIIPDKIIPANIDETPLVREHPKKLSERLAYEKANIVASNLDQGIIISADTVSSVGCRIIDKAITDEDVKRSLKLLSHKRHAIYTAVCIIKKDELGIKILLKVVKSIIKFKKLSNAEIEYFTSTGEGIGKAGGYSLNGYAQLFVSYISGSHSNVIGLPLYETVNMLDSLGFKRFVIRDCFKMESV